ncbi:hypothetical protein phiOC_p339 [Ochrobactrum phage vB_OspM_OC]|nr:hypothetical protein phiOC_p339 [Ochrobactrum phage vB_OspM_OC]
MKRSEILANRNLVIEGLRTKGLRKAQGHLADASNARCCLGHMTHFLGIEGVTLNLPMPIKNDSGYKILVFGAKKEEYQMPEEARIKLGMHSGDGMFNHLYPNGDYRGDDGIMADKFIKAMKKVFNPRNADTENLCSLAEWNDHTNIRPHHIADYLESVIEGGDDTPWKALTDYPE